MLAQTQRIYINRLPNCRSRQAEVQKLPGLESATARLADVVEAKAQQLLAKAKAGQALEADAAAAPDGGAGDVPGAAAAGAAAGPAEGGAGAEASAAVPAAEDAAGPGAGPSRPTLLLPASLDSLGLRQAGRPYNPYGIGCRVCWREADTRRILLCDGCNDEYHCYCLDPPLADVPEEDFYCTACSEALAAGADFGGRRAPVLGPAAAAPAAAAAGADPGEQLAQGAGPVAVAAAAPGPAAAAPAALSVPTAEELLAGPRLGEAREMARLAAALEARPYGEWDTGG